ncbi:LPD5 domain-containing protein [Pseudoalteromonas sp. TB41]|uniref:LPD5 domain-containing protein n=1 Tax=Pseudoalteromonas sp. TB41 TaxID=985149 RepID=UPI0004095F0C|nr:LPD5 domain-containing protein [Pseudoalteromonas sp. TB41]
MAKNYFADEPMPTLFTPTVEPVTKQNSQGLFGDAVDTFQSNIFTSLGGVFDFVGADGLAKSMRDNSEEQYAEVSQQGKDALAKEFVSEDERGNITLGEGATDLDTWLLTMASVAGQFAGTAIPGAGAAGLAGKAASLGAKGKNIANIASMGATGGAAATGQGMEQARQEVQNMPDTLLAESPLFGDVFRGVHANQPELSNVEKWEAAKTALANKVAQEVRTDPKVLLANFGASAIGDPIIGKALTGARLAKSGALRSALAGFVTEGSTEAVQAGVQQLGVNQALQPIDNRDEMQGVVAAGLNEGLAGGGFGAAAGGIGGLVNRQPKQQTPQTEPTAEPAPQSAVDPVTEQMKASNPNLGEAMASMDQHSTNVKSEVDNLDIPTAARQAGFDTNAGAGQFGDFITSPSQESIQSMRNQSIADMINDAINNIGPTPDDRFSPIKYQHVGELLSPEQSTELQPAPRQSAQIDSGFIDGEMVPEQGLLPTQQQTQNRQAFERVQSEFNNQPAQIENKNIIFGEDGRPRQQAAERVKQAGKSAQNLLPQKDIIFAGNESGVNVARNGKPFKSMKEARNSKLARQAKRQGLTVDVVPFDNGYGWKVNEPATLTDEGAIPQSTESNIEVNAQPTANLAGDPINGEWTAFNEQSETKNIPRAEMPQIKAENRGAMVNFMNARDISHEQDEVPASSLKPTQQEFSPAKVKKAMEFEGGNRSILVSSDNHVLDGHHQWLAAREKGEPVKVIRLNAPIEQLVPLAKEMPSTETQDNAGNLTATGNEETATTGKLNSDSGKQSEQKAVKTAETGKLIEQEPAANEQANQLPSILKTTKRKWLQSEAKKLGIKKGSPGYDAAIAKIEESYEPAIDKALAESSFETYQEFNSDTPESINRQAYSELRKEFGLDDQPIEKPQEQKTVQANDTESPNSSENKKVDDPVAADPEANEQQSTTNQATVKQESINDFGEKLGGARKDVWSGFSEAIQDQQSTAELPLGKAWPEPNYKELVDNGASVESVALMAAMRSEVQAKPRLSYKVSRWAEKVNTLKSFAADLMNGDRDVESVMQRMRNHSSKLAAIVDAIPSIAKADLDTLKSVADYRINSGSFSIFGGKTYSPSKVFYFIERNGRPVYDGASETLSDVQALLTKVIKAEQADSSSATSGKKSKISVYRDRYTKDIYLGWKGASGVLKIKSFNDLSAAREYLKNNRDEVEQTLQKMKETPSMRKPVNAERMGPERYAENVTPDTFGETFGFRGVEFGNWVEQAKRQKDLNQAYDGLMDLAEALDLEPKALSLNGKLGLAFGARGKGGKNPAAAHYEPNSVVINLTKKAGSGSLAHEWWHALDNYFGKQKTKGEFITESPYSMSSDEIRPEMASAFKHVKSAIAQSGLPERSRELDTRRSKAYWATPVEMTARSFETYIIDKLNQQGITNDYLANVVGSEAWEAAESLGFESDNTYPYPNKEEQEKINPAYQTLFDTVESENTSEGIRLFSKSKKPASSKSISTEQAQRIADQFVKDLKGANGITVSILDDTATAEKLWRMSLDGATVKGAYSELSKTVYIIAENINDLTDLKQTLAHETIAHGGLDTVIGAEAKQAFIDRIKKTKGRKAFEQYWKDANNDYWDMSLDVKAEEIFARFVENEPSKGELKYWWNALKRWIKAQLDKAGIMYREDDELTAMREMLESIVKGFKAQREPMVSSQAEMTYSQSDKKFSRTADNDSQEKSKIADAVKNAINRENRFEKSSVPEWDALNAQLRETDKTAGEKIKRQLSRWFMPGGNMPETVKQATRGRDRDVAVHEFDVSMLVGKLNTAMKAAKINPDRLTDDQWSKYHQFLIGENDGQSLKQSERETLILMREHIDGLTQDYVASVNNKLQQRFEEDGSIDPKESARLEKMLGNIGKYLNRSYKAFDDPNWFEKIPTDVIDDARTYLMKQYKKDGATIEEAQQKAQVTMNEMVKTGTAYDSLGSFIAESKLGSKDLSTLIPRKDIAPEIRALLGEYVDPRINYAKSVSKMSAMIANDKLLNTIRDMGINNFIFEKDNRPPNATVQLAGEKSEVYAPLNGMWTTPEIKEAFEDAMGGERGEGWLDKAIQINGFIKYGKTVLSPTTAMRNVMSSYFFTVANGHFNQKYMKQAVAAFNAQVKGKVTDGESDYMKRLIKLGVVYDSANAGEMVKMMTDGKVSQMLEGKSGAAFENLRWLTDKATGFYRFGDDFWKIVGFENEKAALIRTGMAESDAEIVAAERIQDTYPTYSRVGKAGVWLSRFPLAGTFVSFPAEIIRTTANMIKLAASEIKSENPEIRAMGAKRVVGISLASGGMFALGALTKAMFGVTDDEEEALRDLAPPWQKNSTFLYAGRDKDGNLRYFDMTFMDPYAYWKRPIEAIMRNQPLNEAITSSIGDMVSPFLGTDISAGKLLEVVSNKKESGGQVYKENDTAIRQGADIAGHLALGLAPGAVNNAWRIGMAAADVKRSTGKPYSLSDEMLALAGFRSSTFDPKVGLYYRTFDFNSAIAEARKELSGVLRNPNKVSDDEISAAKERAKTKQEQAFKQMSRLIKAAETGGASRSQVVQIILLAGISKRNAGFLLRGQVPPVNLSDRSFESAVKRAQLIMDSETAKEVRSRFNRIVTP